MNGAYVCFITRCPFRFVENFVDKKWCKGIAVKNKGGIFASLKKGANAVPPLSSALHIKNNNIMGNTIIRKLAYNKLYFINTDGAIRQLKFIGNKVRHSNCHCEIISDFVFIDGSGKEYLLSDGYGAIYDKLDNAIADGERTHDDISIDINDLILAKGGSIGMTDIQFVAWTWDVQNNKSTRYSVRGNGDNAIKYCLITNDGVKYLTKDYREITPNKSLYLTKEKCVAANMSNVKVVMFN